MPTTYNKCPKCGGQCDYNDVHPDGHYKANYGCLVCGWFEKKVEEKLTDKQIKNLPF